MSWKDKCFPLPKIFFLLRFTQTSTSCTPAAQKDPCKTAKVKAVAEDLNAELGLGFRCIQEISCNTEDYHTALSSPATSASVQTKTAISWSADQVKPDPVIRTLNCEKTDSASWKLHVFYMRFPSDNNTKETQRAKARTLSISCASPPSALSAWFHSGSFLSALKFLLLGFWWVLRWKWTASAGSSHLGA